MFQNANVKFKTNSFCPMYGLSIPIHSAVFTIAEKKMFASGPAIDILARVPTPGPYLNAPSRCIGSMYASVPVAARNCTFPFVSITRTSPIINPYHHIFCSALIPCDNAIILCPAWCTNNVMPMNIMATSQFLSPIDRSNLCVPHSVQE